jgi:signal transduction histidine kinase/CheY-like chemotaxis protein
MKRTFFQKLIVRNYPQLIFVFAAFFLMMLVGGFFNNRILRRHLIEGAESTLFTAEANIKAGFSEADVTLLNSCYSVRDMLDEGESQREITEYLTHTTEWMRRRNNGLLGFYGVYGFIRGEFIDSIGLNPDENYIPQERPWYRAAPGNSLEVRYTVPYKDRRTGDVIISAVRNIDTKDGEIAGILAVDININWLTEYVRSLSIAPGGYGMVVSRDMLLMIHPTEEFMGSRFEDLGKSYGKISRMLANGEEVYAKRITDTGGKRAIVFFRRIFNGWYVGLITPHERFYRELYYAAAALFALGIVLALALSGVLLKINAARMKSDEESKYKSSFLARMSHEIRTPMNVIIGISELVLREDTSPRIREFLTRIKQAGSNLLSIIDDILDFSKIESGKLELIQAEYSPASLFNDCIGIVRTKLGEKPVHLITKIDASLPGRLYGDEIRIRQILLNLLSNAVKYTKEGYITLSVKNGSTKALNDSTKTLSDSTKSLSGSTETLNGSTKTFSDNTGILTGGTALLLFEVSDTGIGIKEKDMEKLFSDFSRIDLASNRTIEGAGLGLVIARNLCRLMGGEVSAESRYGKGSTFRVSLPQKVVDSAPLASVKNAESLRVLIAENRKVYAGAITYSAANLGVNYTLARTRNELACALKKKRFDYALSSALLFDDTKSALEELSPDQRPALALLAESNEQNAHRFSTIPLPLQPLSLACFLNGDSFSRSLAKNKPPIIRFAAPGARVLLVDDISTNIIIAEGLLAPYKTKIDHCLSGAESIRMAAENAYDIIFMDHMMPGIDGVEAAAAIRDLPRSYAKTIPIIALTANTVCGMKEMFLANNFDGFLAKPIDLFKLDEIMTRWIPDEKKKEAEVTAAAVPAGAFPKINGVDTQRGIAMTGNSVTGYRNVLACFVHDAAERLPLLQTAPAETDLHCFIIQIHALKSASATIGAAALYEKAAELERAGKKEDITLVREKLPDFYINLAEVVTEIRKALKDPVPREPVLGAPETAETGEQISGRRNRVKELQPQFEKLRKALEEENIITVDKILAEFMQKPVDEQTKKTLTDISDLVLIAEFDRAKNTVEELICE